MARIDRIVVLLGLTLASTTLFGCGDGVVAGGDGSPAAVDAYQAGADGPGRGDDGGLATGDGPIAVGDGATDLATASDGPRPDGPAIDAPAAGDAAVPIDGGIMPMGCLQRTCQGHLYECGDCLDNDGDGKIDSDDPDCLGTCQNNERGFGGNIPGQNNAPCKADCYFDQDSGGGKDGCEWDHRCDSHAVPPSFDPETGCVYDPKTKFPSGLTCTERFKTQPPMCKQVCGPLTPNGCDCFGCCAIFPNQSTTKGVYLGSKDANDKLTCDLAHAADPKRCRPCDIVAGCFNDCKRCELCLGKNTLPADCFPPPPRPDGGAPVGDGGAPAGDGGVKTDGGPPGGDGGPPVGDGGVYIPDGGVPGQCRPGIQGCGLPGQAPCPALHYCITGCCEMTIP